MAVAKKLKAWKIYKNMHVGTKVANNSTALITIVNCLSNCQSKGWCYECFKVVTYSCSQKVKSVENLLKHAHRDQSS